MREPARRERDGMMKDGGPFAALWKQAYPLLTITALFWAGNSIVGRAASDLVPPAALSFWRWTFALLLLMPLALPPLQRDLPVLPAKGPIYGLPGHQAIRSVNPLTY